MLTFGEALLTYKPTPTPKDLPLTGGASCLVQAVGGAELNVSRAPQNSPTVCLILPCRAHQLICAHPARRQLTKSVCRPHRWLSP